MPRFPKATIKRLRVVPDRNDELHPAKEYERPIADWIADGFTELSIYCERCRAVMPRSFAFLCGNRDPAALCLTDLQEKLRCSRCGQPPRTIMPERKPETMPYQYGHYPQAKHEESET